MTVQSRHTRKPLFMGLAYFHDLKGDRESDPENPTCFLINFFSSIFLEPQIALYKYTNKTLI